MTTGSWAFEELSDGFEAVGQTFGVTFTLLERSELDQADSRGEFGLVERGFKTADGVGFTNGDWRFENVFGEPRDARNARATTTKKSAGAKIIQRARLQEIGLDQ